MTDLNTRMNHLIVDLDTFRINMEVVFDADALPTDVQRELVEALEPVLDTYHAFLENKANEL